MHTIAALSTAPAKSGVAVIRVSGANALDVTKAVFKSKTALLPRQMVYGEVLNTDGIPVDRALAVYFSAPNSFTGEDVCELHCHGSMAVVSSALAALYAHGARPAKAGEFTRRAFLNGKLNLAEAEAVGALIAAETEEAARNASAMLGGALGRALDGVYNDATLLIARFRAVCDYPEEDIEPDELPEIVAVLRKNVDILHNLIDRANRAKVFSDGVDCVILGKPNVGKSSLFNALAGEDRAIVTPTAGTTRDALEKRVNVGGVPLRLVDTAGIRPSDDEIERLGVERARRAGEQASLALLVLDPTRPLDNDDEDASKTAYLADNILKVINKCDLPRCVEFRPPSDALEVSAASGTGLDALADRIRTLYDSGDLRFDGTLLTSARQISAAMGARDALNVCADALEAGEAADMALFDAERALEFLAELFGRNARDDVLDRVFENFCIGK